MYPAISPASYMASAYASETPHNPTAICKFCLRQLLHIFCMGQPALSLSLFIPHTSGHLVHSSFHSRLLENMASGSWTFQQMKVVEAAILDYAEDDPDRWEKIATQVGGGKTAQEVKKYYDDLVADVEDIMAGRVELPAYKDDPYASKTSDVEDTAEEESEADEEATEGTLKKSD